jgi:hypothetical protein
LYYTTIEFKVQFCICIMLVEASLSPAFLLALTLYQAIPLSYVAFERRLEKDQRNCSIFSSFAHQGKMGNVSAKINATVFHFKPTHVREQSSQPPIVLLFKVSAIRKNYIVLPVVSIIIIFL